MVKDKTKQLEKSFADLDPQKNGVNSPNLQVMQIEILLSFIQNTMMKS